MKLEEAKGQWALVTGASAGIGSEFCRQLAAAGMNLVLVARREERLHELAQELTERYRMQTLVLPVDLSRPAAAADIQARVAAAGVKVRLLVNNAAFGQWGRFEQALPEVYQEMIQVNTAALVALCQRFLPDLITFPTSMIINVSSPAALQPVPYMAVYAATKAFVHNFSLALSEEWHDRGVAVRTLVPGPTETEFDTRAGAYASALKGRAAATEVVRAALAQLNRDSPLLITAKGTYKQRLFAGLLPARVVVRAVGRMFRPPEQ